MRTQSRTITTFSVCADLDGSIAGPESVFKIVRAGEAAEGACANPQRAASRKRVVRRAGFRAMRATPRHPVKNTASYQNRQMHRQWREPTSIELKVSDD